MERLRATGRSVFTAKDFPLPDLTPNPVDIERRNRIRLSVAAYAYEMESHQIMSDAEFDRRAETINPLLTTGHPVMDEFFIDEFSPMTGMWIHKHPELKGIKRIYDMFHRGKDYKL